LNDTLTVPFMDAMGVVIPKDAAMVFFKKVRQKKSKIVSHDLASCIHPHFFSQDADATCTSETGDMIGLLAKGFLSLHNRVHAR
jgi:hypothetical protein